MAEDFEGGQAVMPSQVKDAEHDRSQLQDLLDCATHRSAGLEIELVHAQADLARTDICLDRLSSELAAVRYEAERLKMVVDDFSEAKQKAAAKIAHLTTMIDARDGTIEVMIRSLEQRDRELFEMKANVEVLQSASSHFASAPTALPRVEVTESASLQRRLRNAEENAALQRALVILVQGMLQVMTAPGQWWTSLLPRFLIRRLQYNRLRSKGLFDARLYTKRYPDVGRAGLDPLHHYVSHGLEEGRTRL